MRLLLLIFTYFYLPCKTFDLNAATNVILKGHICAYGDMNRDLYTDLIVHDHDLLKIYLQDEDGNFQESATSLTVIGDHVFCAVGDFNGDSVPDILVSIKEKNRVFISTLYLFDHKEYKPLKLSETFIDELSVVDVNGDGTSDLVGFLYDETFYCRLGSSTNRLHPCEHYFKHEDISTAIGFPISFVDVTGDLSADLIFGRKKGNNLVFDVWKRIANDEWIREISFIDELSFDTGKYFGFPIFADFDADGMMDIAVPMCDNKYCSKLSGIKIWVEGSWQLFSVSDLQSLELVSDNEPVSLVLRAGDFTSDGYPDLLVLVKNKKDPYTNPMILENKECTECVSKVSREFILRSTPHLIRPANVSLGVIQMATFFDLKEDGGLDIALEYTMVDYHESKEKPTTIDFIRCAERGDTTFLKVEVFSSACSQDCGSEKIKIGSGIAWHGACVSYNMSVARGLEQTGVQCQMPQTTHRVFHLPFTLFGLGRSPNFVDRVRIGSARVPFNDKIGSYGNQQYFLKQIVPNSRIIIVPPKSNGTHWQSRLYLTPSKLIFQSLLVLVSVCTLLLFVITILYFRERRVDKQERQAQTHRFHFDAM